MVLCDGSDLSRVAREPHLQLDPAAGRTHVPETGPVVSRVRPSQTLRGLQVLGGESSQ